MDEREVLWVAGLLEGEGAFYISQPSGRNRAYARIRLAMNDQDVVERFAGLVEGQVRYSDNWSSRQKHRIYYCYVPMLYVLELALLLRPHMGLRRKAQIDVLLALPPLPGRAGEHNGRHKLTLRDVREIRAAPKAVRTADLARQFGMERQAIDAVRTGKSWRCIA